MGGASGGVDNDGDRTGADNGPLRANASQTDGDGDGIGDACDPNKTVNENSSDFDRDGIGHLSSQARGYMGSGALLTVPLGRNADAVQSFQSRHEGL